MDRKRRISASACAALPSARSAAICRSQVWGSWGWGEAAALRLASAGCSPSGAVAALSGAAGAAADDEAIPVEGEGAAVPAAAADAAECGGAAGVATKGDDAAEPDDAPPDTAAAGGAAAGAWRVADARGREISA